MTSNPRCPYYYHTMTNIPPRRCRLEEGHDGPHIEEQLVSQQYNPNPPTGWFRH